MLISSLTRRMLATAELRLDPRMLRDPGLHSIPRAALHRVAVDLHPGDTP